MSNSEPLSWLLEDDPENPGVKYFALHDLLGAEEGLIGLRRARKDIMEYGPVPRILAAQQPEGNWVPNRGKYLNSVWHYQSTVWQIIFLAELGADPKNNQVRLGCQYLLEHAIAANHAFSSAQRPISSQTLYCMNGHLLWALPRLGFADDERVAEAYDWMAKAISGELPPGQYYKSGTSGPAFACAMNLRQSCGWGATKAMRALVSIPEKDRTPVMQRVVQTGVKFLLIYNLTTASFPCTNRISSTWFKFGFPLSYWSDVLETTQVLVDLGYVNDQHLAEVLRLILGKQDNQGRWKMENSLNGKMWINIETKGQPSKWITLRALRALKRTGLALAGE
jgi:hypothetical protein